MLTRDGRLDQPGASEDDDSRADSFLSLNEFGLEQLELEPNWPEFLPIQELQVLIRSTIGRGPWLLTHRCSCSRDRASTGSTSRALPTTTMLECIPSSCWTSSGLSNSSCNRIGRASGRPRHPPPPPPRPPPSHRPRPSSTFRPLRD